MPINLYDEHDRARREAATAAFMAAAEFPALEIEAKARGFRKATLSEINASAERVQWAPDLYSWRGGLWVPLA
ncbi:hypothetical protein [Burkholderia cenocepacia]|uniref:Acyl-CoA dehydrogenase n=1 Tax=Burkholderia cenocepacia TaxID=95486 RepID=A0A6B2MQV7_9BURK|nr:hypothetical protein [Burkholderia cenocepacia]NDV77292.1 hypothetical protein [Burkholderia cenocepacia]